MIATAVCKRLLNLSLLRPRSGTVHSVFDHAVNLELGAEGLVGLLAEEKTITPYAVSARIEKPFPQAHIRAGMTAYLGEGMLIIPDAQVEIDLARAQSRDLSLDSIAICYSNVKNILERLILEMLRGADAEMSLAPLVTAGAENTFTRFLAPRLERLFCAVSLGAWDEAALAASACAGCGMGLTPSSDDLLCGYITTLHLLLRLNNRADEKDRLASLARAAAEKTNRISGTFLLHSGQALANAAICDLLRSIFSFQDIQAANRAVLRVLAIGSTSGADMLTGLVLALRQNIGGSTS